MRQKVTFEVEIDVEVDEGSPPTARQALREAFAYASDRTSEAAAAAVALMNDWRFVRERHPQIRGVGFRGPTNVQELSHAIVRQLTGQSIY